MTDSSIAPDAPASEHRPCLACGGLVEQRAGEKHSKWLRRKSCSLTCSMTLGGRNPGKPCAPPYAHPPCVQCGRKICRYGSETRDGWITRKYCSMDCRQEAAVAAPPWPTLTADAIIGTPFAAHTLAPGDGGPLRISRPITRVETASTLG